MNRILSLNFLPNLPVPRVSCRSSLSLPEFLLSNRSQREVNKWPLNQQIDLCRALTPASRTGQQNPATRLVAPAPCSREERAMTNSSRKSPRGWLVPLGSVSLCCKLCSRSLKAWPYGLGLPGLALRGQNSNADSSGLGLELDL